MAADDDIDRLVEFLDDVDDRPGYSRTLIVAAGGKAAFVNQHHDGFDPARPEFRHQRVDGLGFVVELEPGDTGR